MSYNIDPPLTPLADTPRTTKGHPSKNKGQEPGSEKKKRKRHAEGVADEPQPKKRRGAEHAQEQPAHQSSTAIASRDSPFCVQTSSLYLPLAPISQLHPLEGLCAEHLSPLLLTYYRPFRGVVLSYSNPRLSERLSSAPTDGHEPVLAKSIGQYAVSFVWVTADFVLFRPRRGQVIEGWINLQNESHLGLVCWNLFNASIERRRLPRDWTWSGVGGRLSDEDANHQNGLAPHEDDRGQGSFVDGEGKAVEGLIQFRIVDAETAYSYGKGFLTIEGTLLDDEGEEGLLAQQRTLAGRGMTSSGKRSTGNGLGDGDGLVLDMAASDTARPFSNAMSD